MAKELKFNKHKAEKEQLEKKKKEKEAEKRREYFKGLSTDVRFKKYIIEEILDVEIRENENISGELKKLITTKAEDVKSILVAKAGALKTSKNIKNKITSNY